MKIWMILSLAGAGMLWGTSSFAQPIARISNSEDSLALVEQVAWYLDYFDISENVFISVILAENIPDMMEGMTFCLNPTRPLPRLIIKLRIDARLNPRKQRLLLAHEMIHVKQYVKGELKVIDKNKVMWKGRTFRNHFKGTNHRLAPWEREAYRTDNLIAKICREQPDKFLLAKTLALDSIGLRPERELKIIVDRIEEEKFLNF